MKTTQALSLAPLVLLAAMPALAQTPPDAGQILQQSRDSQPSPAH